MDIKSWESKYDEIPLALTDQDKQEWLSKLSEVSLSSDAFFPFSDNINRARLVIFFLFYGFNVTV